MALLWETQSEPLTSLVEILKDVAMKPEQWRTCCHVPSNQNDWSHVNLNSHTAFHFCYYGILFTFSWYGSTLCNFVYSLFLLQRIIQGKRQRPVRLTVSDDVNIRPYHVWYECSRDPINAREGHYGNGVELRTVSTGQVLQRTRLQWMAVTKAIIRWDSRAVRLIYPTTAEHRILFLSMKSTDILACWQSGTRSEVATKAVWCPDASNWSLKE